MGKKILQNEQLSNLQTLDSVADTSQLGFLNSIVEKVDPLHAALIQTSAAREMFLHNYEEMNGFNQGKFVTALLDSFVEKGWLKKDDIDMKVVIQAIQDRLIQEAGKKNSANDETVHAS